MEEQIVLLNPDLTPAGSAPKLASHHADTPLHLAFSCYIFDSAGRLLLTRRASTKKVWPGVWTNSVCGHPSPGESLPDAIRRRSDYELGITAIDSLQEILPDYRYITPPFNGIIENEFCPVYAARLISGIYTNPEEVGDYRWVNFDELQAEIATSPDSYSYWMKDQLPLLLARPAFTVYSQNS